MFLAFLFTYVVMKVLGKTIYGILYFICFMIFKAIQAIIHLIEKKAKEARAKLQIKVLEKQNLVKEKLALRMR